jgi:hypothetical protein
MHYKSDIFAQITQVENHNIVTGLICFCYIDYNILVYIYKTVINYLR